MCIHHAIYIPACINIAKNVVMPNNLLYLIPKLAMKYILLSNIYRTHFNDLHFMVLRYSHSQENVVVFSSVYFNKIINNGFTNKVNQSKLSHVFANRSLVSFHKNDNASGAKYEANTIATLMNVTII